MGFLKYLPQILELLISGCFILLKLLNTSNDLRHFSWLIPITLLITLLYQFLNSSDLEEFFRQHIFTLIIFVPILITFGDLEMLFWLASIHLFSTSLGIINLNHLQHLKKHPGNILFYQKLTPAQLIMTSFGGLVMLGALLLILPISYPPGKEVSLIDALFVSSSAVSTTGLSTVSLPDNLTIFGQIVVLILVQIGGIGLMVISSSLTIFSGKNLALRESAILADVMDVTSMEELYGLIKSVINYTFIIEFIGAILIAVGFHQDGIEIGESLYYGFFHSISAFCTAGFSLFNDSFESHSHNPIIIWTTTISAILGGLGFIVLKELSEVFQKRRLFHMLSMHSKVVLFMTTLFLILPSIAILLWEFLGSMADFSLWQKFEVTFFHVTNALTTAGFNSVPLAGFKSTSLYIIVLLMFVGSAPGSTGGGIKLTTLAILFQSVKTTISGKDEVEFFERAVPLNTAFKATAISIISLIIVNLFVVIVVQFEPEKPFLSILFEVMSAFGTVGLSLGITSKLTAASKIALTILMYIGRIGPLTLVLAIGENQRTTQIKYPKSKILIG